MKKEFYDLIDTIRNKMERSNRMNFHAEDKRKWNKYCASIYAIEDSQCAIDSYCDSKFPSQKTDMYLRVYGVMQALFIQQDASSGLLESIGADNLDTRAVQTQIQDLKIIREIRNDTVGHLTERTSGRKNDKKYSYVQISQLSLTQYRFTYFLYKEENNYCPEECKVDLKGIIDRQYTGITYILRQLCRSLDAEYKKYLLMFKEEKMRTIFNNLPYAEEKIRSGDYLAGTGIKEIKEMILACKEALDKRYTKWQNVDSFKNIIEEVEDLLELRNSVVCGKETSKIRKYLTDLMFIKLNNLADNCQEIDELFSEELQKLE